MRFITYDTLSIIESTGLGKHRLKFIFLASHDGYFTQLRNNFGTELPPPCHRFIASVFFCYMESKREALGLSALIFYTYQQHKQHVSTPLSLRPKSVGVTVMKKEQIPWIASGKNLLSTFCARPAIKISINNANP